MLASQRSLASVQLSRDSVTEVAEAPSPLREATLESFRRRNAILDAVFYDVGRVTTEEARAISPWLAREGALLIVPPTETGELRLCLDVDDFAAHGGRDIRVLTVAGVGSSALGSAAFARNVADAFQQPVAAVVSGYGLADLVTEAIGGWLWFGGLNSLRHEFEQLDARSRAPSWADASLSIADSGLHLERLSLDTKTVCALLADARFSFSLLTGHSKGNLVLSEALFALEKNPEAAGKLRDDAWIVKISAAVTIPPRFTNAIDVMGGIDWFGAMNSRPGMPIEKTYQLRWHHTNTEMWFHLPVKRVFRELIASRGIAL